MRPLPRSLKLVFSVPPVLYRPPFYDYALDYRLLLLFMNVEALGS